jgi:hypothetical protein
MEKCIKTTCPMSWAASLSIPVMCLARASLSHAVPDQMLLDTYERHPVQQLVAAAGLATQPPT